MSQSRQLAAIMFTDIVGYTAMMQQSEQKAVAIIKHYNATLEKWVKHFNGQVLNYYGDGSLCIFSSATEAVNCSMELQKDFKTEPVVPLRIGLHIGEVFFEDAKALGDGVNVASRVQSLGQENTILISGEIHDKIKNNASITTVSLGYFDFKNVDKSLEVFALTNEGLFVPQRKKMEGKLKQKSVQKRNVIAGLSFILIAVTVFFIYTIFFVKNDSVADKSIAVLPFKNLSEDKANQQFCDGMMESILNHLTKMKDLHVTSSTSMEQYRESSKSLPEIAGEVNVANILEGSVQRAGGKIKVTAQLIHAASDRHLWSEEYLRDEQDIFALQTEIAKEIASVLKVTLSHQEQEQIARVPTHNLEAWNLYLQAQSNIAACFFDDQKEDDCYQRTLMLCNNALKLDPTLAEAYAMKAKTYVFSERFIDSVRLLCDKALELDPKSSMAHAYLGSYFLKTSKFEKALEHIETAVDLGPNDIQALDVLSSYYWNTGQYEKAFQTMNKELSLASQSVWLPGLYTKLSGFNYEVCDFEKCLELIDKAVQLKPGLNWKGEVYAVTGEKGKCKKFYESAFQADSLNGLEGLATYYAYFEPEKALPYYLELHKKFPEIENPPGGDHRFAHALWAAGRKDEALKEFKKAEDYLIGVKQSGGVHNAAAYNLAGINSFLGRKEKAMEYLREYKGKDWPGAIPYFIQVDPMFDNLRSNLEFQKMVKDAQEDKARLREKIRKAERGE